MGILHTSRRGDGQPDPENSPEKELAISLLQLAVADLRAGSPGARLWFEWPSPAMEFWCQAAGVDPHTVRERALAGAIGQPRQRARAGTYKARTPKAKAPEPAPEMWHEAEQIEMAFGY